MYASFNPGHVGITIDLADGLELAERHGFGGYDPRLVDLHERVVASGATATRALFSDRGLRVGNWNLPFMPYRGSGEELAVELDKLVPMLDSAAAVGAYRSAMWIMPGSNELEFDANYAFHVERFAPVAAALRERGIRLGLEFIGPKTSADRFAYTFIRDLPGMMRLATDVGPNVGILLDSWHWYTSGGTVDQLSALANRDLVHVHINDAPTGVERDEQIDNRRCLPGETGVIDIIGFLTALERAGYGGPVTAEPFSERVSALPADEAAAENARSVLEVMHAAGVA